MGRVLRATVYRGTWLALWEDFLERLGLHSGLWEGGAGALGDLVVGMADDLVVCRPGRVYLHVRNGRLRPAFLLWFRKMRFRRSSGSGMSGMRCTPNTTSKGEVFLVYLWSQK